MLERIGALIVAWAIFEVYLEQAIWRLADEEVAGSHPSTDRMQSKQKIDKFRKLADDTGGLKWKVMANQFCDIADDVLIFRNALSHGHPGMGSSISNMSWRGEKRARRSGQAHYEIWTTGCMIEAIDIMLAALMDIAKTSDDWERPEVLRHSIRLKDIRSMVGQAAHLIAYMNHEKN